MTRKHLVQLNICSLQLDALHEHRELPRKTERVRQEGTHTAIHIMQIQRGLYSSDAVLSLDTDVSPLNVPSC